MADIILSFRQTAGFVTDATGTYVLEGDTYPTTRGGSTFGYANGIGGTDWATNDRDATVTDKHLAGQHQVIPNDVINIRADLTAPGTYDVRWANGDTGFDFSPYQQNFEIFDNVTSKYSYQKVTGPAQDHYFDATGVDRTEAAWPGSNAAQTVVFASSTFFLRVGSTAGAGSGYQVYATLQIIAAAGVAALVHRSLQCETGVYRSFA